MNPISYCIAALVVASIVLFTGKGKPLTGTLVRALCAVAAAALLVAFARSSPQNFVGLVGGSLTTALAFAVNRLL